jgi:hypothetical protein
MDKTVDNNLTSATSGSPPRPGDLWRARLVVEEQMRRRRNKVVVVVAGLVICFLGLVIAVRMTHLRDESDFLLAVEDVAPQTLDDDDLVAEGDAACQWLSWQERAWWNHGAWFDRDDVLARYVRTTRPIHRGAWGTSTDGPANRLVVADAAWSQLCGGTWWWHRPHGPSLSLRNGGGEGGSD